jgi:uncharacterized protein YigE (DUF2233 family)
MKSRQVVSLICLTALLISAACKITAPEIAMAQEAQVINSAFDRTISVQPSDISKIEIHSLDKNGHRYGSFKKLFKALKEKGQQPSALINAGMVEPDGSAVGLLIVAGSRLHEINLMQGKGNFFMGKKGVFGITKKGKAEIFEPSAKSNFENFEYATQSGPLLIQQGRIVAEDDWRNPKSRSAVGISVDGSVTFVQDSSKGLRQLAEDGIKAGFKDMLFLDGGGYDCIATNESEVEANYIGIYAGIISIR